MHIAKYHRVFNVALGLETNQMANFGKGKQHKSRYFRKLSMKREKSEQYEKEIVIDMSGKMHQDSSKFCHQTVQSEQFIPINSIESEEDHASLESISGKHSYPDQEVSSIPLPDDSHSNVKYKETEYQKIQRQSADFNRYLRENPHDVNKWIEFVHFQDTALLVKDVETAHANKKAKISHVLLDIKLSVVEKALAKNPASLDLKKLQLLLGAEEWSTSKLGKVCSLSSTIIYFPGLGLRRDPTPPEMGKFNWQNYTMYYYHFSTSDNE